MLARFDQGERYFTQEDGNVHACNPSTIETMHYQAWTEVPIQSTLQFSCGSTSRTGKNKNDKQMYSSVVQRSLWATFQLKTNHFLWHKHVKNAVSRNANSLLLMSPTPRPNDRYGLTNEIALFYKGTVILQLGETTTLFQSTYLANKWKYKANPEDEIGKMADPVIRK